MADSIYLIQRTQEREGFNGWYDETVIEDEYGYFADKQAAQDFCDGLNNDLHLKNVESSRRSHESHAADTARRQAEHDTLTAAGLKPSFWRPNDPKPFEEPKRVDEYNVLEVEPA